MGWILIPKLINKLIRRLIKIIREFRGQLHFDNGDYRDTVILAGSGRSGTTWVQELINNQNDFRIMFEPFHSLKIDLLKTWNFRQYIRSDDSRDMFLIPATRILSGGIRHKWIDRYNRKTFPGKRLIKDIRIQLLLHWIKGHFPEIPIIVLLRHPCAVANSRLKQGWPAHLEDFLIQDDLFDDFLDPFRQEIENAKDLFDQQIFMWCIENYVPLKQFKENEILVVFYEQLCRNPHQEMSRMMEYIGKSFSSDMLDKISRPSAQSRKDSAIISGVDPVSAWRNDISDEQVKRAVEILRMFGLHQVYSDSDMPLVDGSKALSVFSDQ